MKLKDIGKIVTGKTPSTKQLENFSELDDKYLFVTPRDMKDNCKYIESTERYLTSFVEDKFKSQIIKKDSVCISCIGSDMGKVYMINRPGITNQQINSITAIKDICNPHYLYYYFSDKKEYLKGIAGGSTMPILNKSTFENIEIDLPARNIQDKIVKILNNIDNKIELNNKTNDNLYELSFSLYKKWYDSLSSDNITTLSKFDEMGKIVMGQSPKGESYNYYNEGLPLINGAADYENGFLKAQKYTTMPTKICNKNDLIFCIRATIGLLTICDKEYCLGRGVAGIVNINELYREYVFHLINNSIESFKNLATGSVIVGISRNDIQNIKVKIPSKEQIKKFHDIQKKLFDKMENIRQENIVLTQLRDTLLPKLMNGEIDLDKIEI